MPVQLHVQKCTMQMNWMTRVVR